MLRYCVLLRVLRLAEMAMFDFFSSSYQHGLGEELHLTSELLKLLLGKSVSGNKLIYLAT
jgi:hypothetical protein